MESPTAVESSATVEPVAVPATITSPVAMAPVASAVPVTSVPPVATTAVVPMAVVPTAIVRTPVISRPIIAVIPGACADKHAPDKIARPVIPIGRAGIGIVVIVAVRANWRRPNRVSGPIADTHGDLRRGMYCHHSYQNS